MGAVNTKNYKVEKRNLQKTNTGQTIITVPKVFVDKKNWNRGSFLYWIEKDDYFIVSDKPRSDLWISER